VRTVSFIALWYLMLSIDLVVLFVPKVYRRFTVVIKYQRKKLNICKTAIPYLTYTAVVAESKVERETYVPMFLCGFTPSLH
jgi:chloramphenicol O-acetyltransferase